MPKRPTNVPHFATDTGADLVAPSGGVLSNGYLPADRPPAQHFNWLFNTIGAWIDTLRGANPATLTRIVPSGLSTDSLIAIAVDSNTPEVDDRLYRMIAIDDVGSFSSHVWVSVNGTDWSTQANAGGSPTGAPTCVAVSTLRCYVGLDAGGGTGNIAWTWLDGVASSALTPSGSPPAWNAVTLPGSTTPIVEIGWASDTDIVAVSQDKIMFCTDGFTFTNATLSGGPAGGNFSGLVRGVGYWVAITDTGEIWRASTGGSTWSKITTLPAALRRLVADDTGVMIAYVQNSGSTPNWYISGDDGGSWSSKTPPSFKHIQRIRFLNGMFFLAGTNVPFLACANGSAAAEWIRLPVPSTATSVDLYDVAYGVGAVVAIGTGHTLLSTRAIDTSPGDYVPDLAKVPILADVQTSGGSDVAVPGTATVNGASGRVKIAVGASSIAVSNSLVTAASHILAMISQSSADATLTRIERVAAGSGTFTIYGNANATAAVQVDFFVMNNP